MITALEVKKAVKRFYHEESKPDWYNFGNRIGVKTLKGQRNGEKYVAYIEVFGWAEDRLKRFINKLINGVDQVEYGTVRMGVIALSPADWEKVISKLGNLE